MIAFFITNLLMSYSIIIPIHNEEKQIPFLLENITPISINHEIIIIDDGSTDGSLVHLDRCSFITLIKHDNKLGKGQAIRTGLDIAKNDKIILFDGDMELNPVELPTIMVLNKEENIDVVFGTRLNFLSPLNTIFDFGNFLLNGFFNFLNQSNYSDVLCGCKAFYKSDLAERMPYSIGFDIDVEIASNLVKNKKRIIEIPISYSRRNQSEGKKLNVLDGWLILKRMLFTLKYKKKAP